MLEATQQCPAQAAPYIFSPIRSVTLVYHCGFIWHQFVLNFAFLPTLVGCWLPERLNIEGVLNPLDHSEIRKHNLLM